MTITFTPTAAGFVNIEAWAYGGTTDSVYVDDMTLPALPAGTTWPELDYGNDAQPFAPNVITPSGGGGSGGSYTWAG